MRRQFVLDLQTERLLSELAATRAGNRSFVVREAIQLFADLEGSLEEIESTPGFRRMMQRSARAIREGRVHTHAEVVRQLRKRA